MNNLFKFRMKAFALAALLLAGLSSAFAQQKDTIAIVNAGSSGTRLYVYEIDPSAKAVDTIYTREFPIRLSDMAQSDPEPGITRFCNTLEQANILGKKMKLYILATAGMRNVNATNAARIYDSLKARTFSKYERPEAMTISGRYEGLYAWMAANYNTLRTAATATPENTRGILEIGGQSMQIAFVKNDNISDIERNNAYIYSKSYINGGVNAVNSPGAGLYETHVPDLPDVKRDIPEQMKFYGLGGTINGINGTDTPSNSFGKKVKAKARDDSNPYKKNACYLKWVLEQLGLLGGDKIIPIKVDWTLGAAYDIGINSNADLIEAFDYGLSVPN